MSLFGITMAWGIEIQSFNLMAEQSQVSSPYVMYPPPLELVNDSDVSGGPEYWRMSRQVTTLCLIALQNERIQWQDCLAFTLISNAAISSSPCSEYPTTCAKTGSPVEWMNITFVQGLNMVVRSSSISAKVSKVSRQEYSQTAEETFDYCNVR